MKKSTVSFYRMDSQLMNDAIDRIVVKVHTYKKAYDKKTILLTGCSPSSGVTTTSINLAIALSLAGWKTLLLDCDLRKANKYKRLGEEASLGLSDYLAKKANQDQIINKTNYELLDYVACGTNNASAVRMLCSADMNSFMKAVQEEYDYIILDSPSINIVSDASILFPYVDGIALVTSLNQTTKKQIRNAKRIMDKYSEKYYGLVINQVNMGMYGNHIPNYDYFKQNNMDKKYERDMKKVNEKKNNKENQEESHE